MINKILTSDEFFIGIIILLSILLIYTTAITNIIAHEQAHVQINKYFGVESTVEINYFNLSGKTIPIGDFKDYNYKNMATVAHGVNEAVGYQTVPYFLGIMAMQVIILLFVVINFMNNLVKK